MLQVPLLLSKRVQKHPEKRMYEIKSLFKLASEFTQRVIFSYFIMQLFRLIISWAVLA